MNSPRVVLVLLAVAAVVVSMSLFTVDERDLAVKFRFGEIIKTDFEPGLHFKIPIVNNVNKYPRRLLAINNPQELFLTVEKKNLLVDFFIEWRISDVGDFYRTSGGDELVAAQRLLEIVKDGIRAEFAKRTVLEVVSAERRDLMDDMLAKARANAVSLGIDVVDVRVERIEFSDEVSESVFNRMRQERARIAAELRAQGAENAERIRAEADRERTVLLAEAYRDAEILRGAGDATAAEIYAKAYDKDRDFYSFHRSIQAYRRAIGQPGDLLILDSKGEFFHYLNQAGNKD
ncbi:MAG: protease modulator HflC [Gammaproteobacteria bacterium]|nr:protease modulator HflC [Gammaproteobacteria bacterium]